MGNENTKSYFSQTASTAVGSTMDPETTADNDPDLDNRLRQQWQAKQRKSNARTRRRSVSVNVRSIRRESSMIHENLVKINLLRSVRQVWAGLDSPENKLGEGTWGTVKLVHRRDDPSKKAAIKVLQLTDDLDSARMNELRSEINLLQKIDHPHIAKLYETYEDDGLNLYLVMEYLSGGELFDRVIELGYFKESKAAEAVKQMVGAVQYLHSRGIVHRDLKLENFMYRSKDSDNLVLIDFGLSCKYTPTDPSDNKVASYMKEMVGSSYYMAPEVMKRKYGQECDMWSIGVIAYMLLSGHPPFAGDTDAEIMRRVKRGNYHFNHSAFNKVADSAKDFVSKLLIYEPASRMSAKDALLHPWLSDYHKKQIQRRSQRRGSFIDRDVVQNLKNFVHTNRFKKLALQAVAYSTSYEDIAHLQQIFEDIDQDQDGYISMEELQHALRDNPTVDSASVVKIFEAMDVDKLQKVHLNEFIAAALNHSIVKDETILTEAFRRLDVNETGSIDRDDLADLLGKNFDRKQVEEMLREFTKDSEEEEGLEQDFNPVPSSSKILRKKKKTLTKVTQKDFVNAMRRVRINQTENMLLMSSNNRSKATLGSGGFSNDLTDSERNLNL